MQHFKRFLPLIIAAVVLIACGGEPTELLETAQLEERQLNAAHAIELYQEIVTKHPDSKAATVARERLEALQSQAQ